MSCPADSESSPTGASREEYDNHNLVPEDELVSQWKGREENKTAETEKVAVRALLYLVLHGVRMLTL
jgi:hypothetical protein